MRLHDDVVTMTPADARSALQLAQWRVQVGLQSPEALVGLAVDALVAGLDGPALGEMAGADDRDSQSLREAFESVIEEQGLELGDEQSALWGLVRHVARQIVNGSLDPIEGAEWIWINASHLAEREGDFRIFTGLVSEHDDNPGHREEIERETIAAAADLLDRERPRRWL